MGNELEGERHIEMTWHCAGCKKQNLGRFKSCQHCGKPKGDEEYEMPEHTELAATVTDAALLRMAMAGPDWRCAYCGSAERATDGACVNCGASAPGGTPTLALESDPAPGKRRRWLIWAPTGAGVSLAAVIGLVGWNSRRPHEYDGVVSAVAWEHVIEVDHYANHEHDGFKEQLPDNATDITSLGQKLHHQEQVLDHMETEHYTEEVPDGYRTEHYTEQVSCGQDCTTSSPICHEECTSKKNGFASCRQVCSGGGQSCTTKFCTESRTRDVPKTRTESRTREVPRYRSEPRYAEAFHYKAWDWVHDRTVIAKGDNATGLYWPENGAKESGLPEGEREREERHATYRVTLRYHDETVRFAVTTPATLAPFVTHSKHAVRRVRDLVYVDDSPITPLPDGAP